MNRPLDPNAFRSYELEGWQQAAEAYSNYFDKLTSQTVVPLLDAVNAGRNTELLDIATGPGFAAAEGNARGAKVIGVDFSESMITIAKRLNPQIDFRIGDAEQLPFPDAQFDAAVMNFGILHLPNPVQALSEACRVLRPGGRAGFTAWASPDKAIGFKFALSAIEKHGDPNIPLPPAPPFFLFSDAGECKRALTAAGFVSPVVSEVPIVWKLSSGGDLFDAFLKGTARTGGLLRAQTAQALTAIREEVVELCEQFRKGGVVEIPMPAVLASAVRIA